MPDGSVSVVIPARDRAALLAEALRSVREQTLPVARVIVADDGSRDATPQVAEKLGAVVIRAPRSGWGPAAARNAGLAHVETEYVGFLDSDDLLLPDAVALLREALERAPHAPFAYGQGLGAFARPGGWEPDGLIATSGRELERPLCSLLARNRVPSSGALVRVDAARAAGGYDESLAFSEDHAFWLRLATAGIPAHVPEVVSIYRRHEGNRHVPEVQWVLLPTLAALARQDDRLRPCLAEWVGVQACEQAIGALHARRVRPLGTVAIRLVATGSGLPRALSAALRHLRVRRAGARRARELWRTRADLREWLATYA